MFRIALCSCLVLGLAALGSAQLSGNYTIDPNGSGSRNYVTFSAAVSALSAGVAGPVVFQVTPTTYHETVTINPISGTSATSTVTFIAASLATIDAGAAANGLTINGACSYLVFENIEVTNVTQIALNVTGPSATRATFLTFKGCVFEAPAGTASTVRSAWLNYPNDCTFFQCKFLGGGWAFYTQQINRCLIDTCEFDGKGQAAYLIAPFNSNDADNLWMNNFFHDCGPSGHGLYFNWSQYGNMFWHNTVIMNTSADAVFMGSCCAWSRCQSWRNNIIVNLGSGAAAVYGISGAVLDYNDMDYNCYFAPNTTSGTIQVEQNLFRGTLAQWKTHIKANPALIPAGGGTIYDDNSIETDPGLVSMTAPYDIHLKGNSPCLDGGTATYIAGTWVSFPPAGSSLPSSVALDFEGETRGAIPDIGADEVSVQIVGSGSPTPGSTLILYLLALSDAGLPYQVGTSLSGGPTPIGTRQIGLGLDAILDASVNGYLPTIFANYTGVLDPSGQGQAAINIPNLPALKGVRLYSAFVTVKAGAPFGIESISNTFIFTIS